MKQTLLQSLLVATGLFAGTCATFADTDNATVRMTYVSGTDDDVVTSFGDIAEGETARSGYNKISGGSVELAMKAWGVNYITYIQVDASEIPGTITSAKLSMDVSGSSDNKRNCIYGVGYNASKWGSGMTWSTADRTITTVGSTVSTSTKSSTKFETKEVDITDALKDDEDKIVTLLVYETAAAGGYIKNPVVTIDYIAAGAKTGTMTVHYVDNVTKEEIKESRVETLADGTACSVNDDDLKEIVTAEGKKYICTGNNAGSKTVKADENTNVYVFFEEAEKYKYSLNAVDAEGNQLMTMTEGEAYAGDNVTVPYMAYYLDEDGSLLQAGKKDNGKEYNYTFAVDQPDQVFTITYNATDVKDVYFLGEGEDISGMEIINSGNSAIRSSQSACGYAKDGDVRICTLAPGKYKITSVACDFAGREASAVFNYKVNDEVVFKHTVAYINWDEQTSDEFEVTSTTSLFLEQTSNSKQGIDLVYIVKTGDVTTGIDDVKAADAADTEIYNVQGIRLAKPAKGLNIINGKKVIVK